MDKEFEALIEQVMDENDEVFKTLAKMEQDEKKRKPLLYILTEGDRSTYTKARLDLPMFYTTPDNPVTLRQDLNESAEEFGEGPPSLDEMSDDEIFDLADWFEYLWTK